MRSLRSIPARSRRSASASLEAVRADQPRVLRDGRLVATIGDVAGELAERRYGAEWIATVFGLDGCDVHEGHAVLEPERRITETARITLGELCIDAFDQALVLGDALWLHLVADNDF